MPSPLNTWIAQKTADINRAFSQSVEEEACRPSFGGFAPRSYLRTLLDEFTQTIRPRKIQEDEVQKLFEEIDMQITGIRRQLDAQAREIAGQAARLAKLEKRRRK